MYGVLHLSVSVEFSKFNNFTQGWKKRFFRKKFLGFFRFQCTDKTGHKISTQVEHRIYNSLSLSEHFL